jgi:hypothetical protein
VRRAGPTAAVSVEEDGAIALPQDAHIGPGIQLALAVEVRQDLQHRDAVVGMAMELGVDQEPGQPLRVFSGEPEHLERGREATLQLVDPHEPRACVSIACHQRLHRPLPRHGTCLRLHAPVGGKNFLHGFTASVALFASRWGEPDGRRPRAHTRGRASNLSTGAD